LCLNREEFREAVMHLDSADVPKWMNAGANATMHTFSHVDGGIVCIVCLEGSEGRNPVAVAGLLVHEAVHIWQQWCEEVGEKNPGEEQEAYAIQFIAQELMAEFARRNGVSK
jgi:hypothetical protein